MDYIVVGEIIKAQGIKGEVKVRSLTDDSTRFKKLKIVYIDNIPKKIMSVRADGAFVYIKFSGVDTRDDATAIVGKFIEIDKINAVALPQDSYFIADLLNCTLKTEDGLELGEVLQIDSYGAADVITAKSGDKVFRFPFLKKIIKSVDIENKLIILIKAAFDEVCVYEHL